MMDSFALSKSCLYAGASGTGNLALGSAGKHMERGGTNRGGECSERQKVNLYIVKDGLFVAQLVLKYAMHNQQFPHAPLFLY